MTSTPNPVPGDLAAVSVAEQKAATDQAADDAVIAADVAQAEKDEAAQTAPPAPTPTFSASASGTTITVTWANLAAAPTKVGRNGVASMIVAAPSSIDPDTMTNAGASWPSFDLDLFP